MNDLIELLIIDIRQETADTKSFILRVKNGGQIHFQPGQFLTFVFPHKLNENRRSYSISSTPYLNEPLTITVKKVDNGEFSRYLLDYCHVGSSLYTIGASGLFTLPSEPERFSAFVFYAAGSGITPILPLIKTLLNQYARIKIHLSYSNRSPEHTIFRSEIEKLQKDFSDRFLVEWLYSNAKNLLRARMTKSLVAEHVNNVQLYNKDNAMFYLCGPYDYMRMISITLLREGISADRIRKEIFDAIKPIARELPPDTTSRNVTVHYRGRRFDFTSTFPDTILETAKRNNIILPYSCEAGKCGTCAATCTEGNIWMSNNEVLLDSELAKGRILTCTGYPVYGDATLRYSDE